MDVNRFQYASILNVALTGHKSDIGFTFVDADTENIVTKFFSTRDDLSQFPKRFTQTVLDDIKKERQNLFIVYKKNETYIFSNIQLNMQNRMKNSIIDEENSTRIEEIQESRIEN